MVPGFHLFYDFTGQGIAAVKSDRFVVPKEITPGPGQYDVDKPKVVHSRPAFLARQSSFKTSSQNGSRASSSASLYTEVDDTISFKTPSKKSGSSLLIEELQQKYDKVTVIFCFSALKLSNSLQM